MSETEGDRLRRYILKVLGHFMLGFCPVIAAVILTPTSWHLYVVILLLVASMLWCLHLLRVIKQDQDQLEVPSRGGTTCGKACRHPK